MLIGEDGVNTFAGAGEGAKVLKEFSNGGGVVFCVSELKGEVGAAAGLGADLRVSVLCGAEGIGEAVITGFES